MANRIIVNLDTSKSQYNIFECKQNDDLILEANIFENGIEKDVTTKAITINCTRADGTYVVQNTDITRDKNKIIANLKRDFTRVAGLDKLEIVLLENEKQNTTFDFNILVKPSVLKAAVEESKDTVIILEELGNKIVEAGQVKAETENLIATGNAATKLDIANVNSQLEHNTQDITQLKVDIGTTSNLAELISTNNQATVKIAELDSKLTQIGNISTVIDNVEDNKKDFTGTVHTNMYEAKMKDLGDIYDRFNDASLLEYTGTNISANNSYKGLLKDVSIKGRTLQNLVTFNKEIRGDCWNYYVPFSNLLKVNTEYTIVVEISNYSFPNPFVIYIDEQSPSSQFKGDGIRITGNGKFVFKRSTKADFNNIIDCLYTVHNPTTESSGKCNMTLMILEGDYTNTPLSDLPHVDGIKSVGELENKVIVKSFYGNQETQQEIALTEPLRSYNGSYDEIINGKLIRRVQQSGDVLTLLETPIITDVEPIILNSFDTTTNIASDNLIAPTITTKVPSNVQAVISTMQIDNENLVTDNRMLKEENTTQNSIIDTNLYATDELYTMIEPFMPVVMTLDEPSSNNKMVDFYVVMVQRGLKTIDEVPLRLRAEVETILNRV